MNHKQYLTISAVIFTVVAIAHLARIILQLEANVAGVPIPDWASAVAVLLAGYLAVRGFMEAHKLSDRLM